MVSCRIIITKGKNEERERERETKNTIVEKSSKKRDKCEVLFHTLKTSGTSVQALSFPASAAVLRVLK